MKSETIREENGISILEREGKGSTGILLFHGYGASMADLAPLADYPVFPEATWLFPDAPLSVDIGMGMEGRAWFPLDVMELQEAVLTGHAIELSKNIPVGMDDVTDKLIPILRSARERFKKLFVGGFSQGSMVALHAVAKSKIPVEGLLLLSSTLVAENEWKKVLPALSGTKVFQSHGQSDPVLSFSAAEKLHFLLKNSGLDVAWHPFYGGHEIPVVTLKQLGAFLAQN